ncbi:MAG: glycosyltransferase family 4 protein [Candidatus Acidiferrum sp.]
MRLAVVSPFVDRRHGTERALAELLERLASVYGCEIHLYAQRVEDLRLSGRRSPLATGSGGIFWRKVPTIPGPHVMQFLAWMLLNGFLRSWDALIGRVSFDLVLSPGINCLHPDVVIVHALFHRLRELAREETKGSGTRGNFFRRLHRRVYYALLASLERRIYADKSIFLAAVSNRTKAHLQKYFRRRDVTVIPNGVNTAQFSAKARVERREQARQRRGFRDSDFVLLLIGNDWRVKGLPAVLDAMAVLLDSPLHLVVVGNDVAEPFRSLAMRLKLGDRCHWESPNSDVLDFYAAADLYVSPSREDSFGLPVAEAMACGLPVITSIHAGVADYIRDGVDGFVLREPGDAQALAELIERLRTDAQLRRSMAEAAAKAALEWTWERNAAAVWELLRNAEAKRHPKI